MKHLARFSVSIVSAATLVIAVGCGGATHAATSPTTAASAAPSTSASTSPGTSVVVIISRDDDPGGTSQEVFDRAGKEFAAGNYRKSRTLYDRVVEAEKSRQPPQALTQLGRSSEYNAGLCSEALDEVRDARDRYKKAAEDAMSIEGSPDATDALIRRARADVEIEDDDDLAATTPLLLARKDLHDGDRAETLAIQATGRAHKLDLDLAERDYVQAKKLLDAIANPAPQNASAIPYAHGEILRMRSLSVKLVPVTSDFGAKLENRCEYLQDAQDAFIDAMVPADVRWTARAGIRIASMYLALHDELMTIPPPPAFSKTEGDQKLFRAAMRVRYRVFAEKGLGVLDSVLHLDGKAGVHSQWIDRAKSIRDTVVRSIADEKAELAKLPYSEREIQQQLDKLAQKAGSKGAKP